MVQPGREQLAGDPAAQGRQCRTGIPINGQKLRPELVAPAQLAQGPGQGRVLAEAGAQHGPPGARVDHLAPHRQGTAPGDAQQRHQHQGRGIPAGPHPAREPARGGHIPAVARHSADARPPAGASQGREPVVGHHGIGIHQGHQLGGRIQRPEGLVQGGTLAGAAAGAGGEGRDPGLEPAGRRRSGRFPGGRRFGGTGLQPGHQRLGYGPGGILAGIQHQLQPPDAGVALARQGRQHRRQGGIGPPQTEHHLRHRPAALRCGGPSLPLPQPPLHHQGEGEHEQGLEPQGEQQRRRQGLGCRQGHQDRGAGGSGSSCRP